MTLEAKDFEDIIGEDLSGVTFVRDYLQLQFNPPPTINAYNPVTVKCGEELAIQGQVVFANLLINQINKYVRSVNLIPDQSVDIIFEDGSQISISLRQIDYVGAEALEMSTRDERLIIVQTDTQVIPSCSPSSENEA